MPCLLITGSNRGLGLEFVRQYAADGATVIAVCRDPKKATDLQSLAAHNKSISVEALDVSQDSSIKALASKLKGTAIDILINNAGILSGSSKGPATETDKGQQFGTIDAEGWAHVFAINSIAPIMVIEALMPSLRQGKEKKIVNITSRMGSIAEMGSDHIAYRSSKAALNAGMAVIAHDLKSEKIAIINLHPGWVKTDMGGKSATLEPSASIAGMRKVIAHMGLKDTGQFLSYDGKMIAW